MEDAVVPVPLDHPKSAARISFAVRRLLRSLRLCARKTGALPIGTTKGRRPDELSVAQGMIEPVVAVARVVVGAAAIADALRGLNRAIAVRPHRNWAFAAVACQVLGGCVMLLGLGGPIGPGAVAEVVLVVAVVSSAPPGYWEVSGRLGYFPALRAMSHLARGPARLPMAAAAIGIAVLGNGTPSLDGILGIQLPSLVTTGWFAYLILSALLVVMVRLYQGPN